MITVYEKAVDKWGKNHQLLVTAEEMGEAIAKISQFVNRGREVEKDLICELADVQIMLNQCKVIYGSELDKCIELKLKKLEGYING